MDIDVERPEVPVVDADDAGCRVGGDRKFLGAVHLDQGIQPERRRASSQMPQRGWGQRRHDQQNGIRAVRPRFKELILRDDEVLPQQRRLHGLTRGAQMIERAVEECGLGEDRDRCRSRRGIAACDPCRVKVGPNDALRRRPTFAFGDDVDTTLTGQLSVKQARSRGSILGPSGQPVDRLSRLSHLDNTAGGGDDRLE